jgi:hypothetical protein
MVFYATDVTVLELASVARNVIAAFILDNLGFTLRAPQNMSVLRADLLAKGNFTRRIVAMPLLPALETHLCSTKGTGEFALTRAIPFHLTWTTNLGTAPHKNQVSNIIYSENLNLFLQIGIRTE